LRRIVLLGLTIPQISSAGIAFALLLQGLGWFGASAGYGEDGQLIPAIGALIFTIGGALLLGLLVNRRPEFADVTIGVVFAVASALSLLLLAQNPMGEAQMLNLLKGEIIAASDADLLGTLVIVGILLGAFFLFQKEFLLISYDRDFAITLRKPVALYDSLFYVVAGGAVALFVLAVGPVTTFGYLVLAPMAALTVTRRMPTFFLVAAVIGLLASLCGLTTGFFFDLPAGPTTVAVLALTYLFLWLGNKAFSAIGRSRAAA